MSAKGSQEMDSLVLLSKLPLCSGHLLPLFTDSTWQRKVAVHDYIKSVSWRHLVYVEGQKVIKLTKTLLYQGGFNVAFCTLESSMHATSGLIYTSASYLAPQSSTEVICCRKLSFTLAHKLQQTHRWQFQSQL